MSCYMLAISLIRVDRDGIGIYHPRWVVSIFLDLGDEVVILDIYGINI